MNKWRYKVELVKISAWSKAVDQATVVEEKLARLGMEGWELVNAINHRSNSYSVSLYLKRPY